MTDTPRYTVKGDSFKIGRFDTEDGIYLHAEWSDFPEDKTLHDDGRQVVSIVPSTKHPLGPTFEITTPNAKQGRIYPVCWYEMLRRSEPDKRKDMIQRWRRQFYDDPQRLMEVTVSQAQAAKLLDISKTAVKKLIDANVVRWIKIKKAVHNARRKNVAIEIKGRDTVLVHTADVLAYAAQRITRLSGGKTALDDDEYARLVMAEEKKKDGLSY